VSTPDITGDLRAKLCEGIGCTGEYLDETVKMLSEDRWQSGQDVDRDRVVEALAICGISFFQFLGEARPELAEGKVDYTKGGSVFDD
jgi:hypothetical protein